MVGDVHVVRGLIDSLHARGAPIRCSRPNSNRVRRRPVAPRVHFPRRRRRPRSDLGSARIRHRERAIESGDAQQALNILDGKEPEDDDPSHEYWAQIIAAALIDLGKLADAEHFIQSHELRCATYHVLTTRAFYADQWNLAASLAMESFERFEDLTAAYNAACSHARAGRITDGMAWLNRAVDRGFAKLEQLDTDSDIDALRQHPDFEALRDRIA